MLLTHKVVILSLVLLGMSTVLTVPVKRSQNKNRRRTLRQGNTRSGARQPWQVNQDICPPSLCGPRALPSVALSPGAKNVHSLRDSTFPFFEGDIVLDDDLRGRMGRGKRAVIRPISHLWQYGIVPYRIDSSFNGASKRVIREAMEVYQNETCIKFRRRDGDRDYIQFANEPGCWSFVGNRSIGVQKIGVGDGCIQLGTVLHELGHALGFWHEQSRADRDDYIEIVEENVADRYIDQFDKRTRDESTARGFPYDYESIMHYGKADFSNNGRPTLKLQGVGTELDVRIGQRKRLSDIDIAQLKDIYFCNVKDAKEKGIACDSGWEKFNRKCYKFESNIRQYFKGAVRHCNGMDAHLLHIESREEDKFIKEHLITKYSDFAKWRIGGKGKGRNFMWYDGRSDHDSQRIRDGYTAWAPSYPGSYNTLTLELYEGTPPRYVWRADWAGNENSDKYSYPFICEKPLASTKCFRSASGTGSDYRGYISYTRDYITCQRWTEQYPHKHGTVSGDKERDKSRGLGNHNYCRNPGGKRERPWCFTTKQDIKWQYCDVYMCDE